MQSICSLHLFIESIKGNYENAKDIEFTINIFTKHMPFDNCEDLKDCVAQYSRIFPKSLIKGLVAKIDANEKEVNDIILSVAIDSSFFELLNEEDIISDTKLIDLMKLGSQRNINAMVNLMSRFLGKNTQVIDNLND